MERKFVSGEAFKCSSLSKKYSETEDSILVLDGISFEVAAGESVALTGSSGSGKSTLLNILAGIDEPSSGTVELKGRSINHLSDSELACLRNRELGFVYQFHHLLPEFNVLENVAMPLIIGGMRISDAMRSASPLLKRVGLEHRYSHTPKELSGGERQRAAVARALVNKPSCVLADEPTGNLDARHAQVVIELLVELCAENETAIIVATHDTHVAKSMQRALVLRDGQLFSS
jgi:lipoprotein-releasing system ATP-binding protein